MDILYFQLLKGYNIAITSLIKDLIDSIDLFVKDDIPNINPLALAYACSAYFKVFEDKLYMSKDVDITFIEISHMNYNIYEKSTGYYKATCKDMNYGRSNGICQPFDMYFACIATYLSHVRKFSQYEDFLNPSIFCAEKNEYGTFNGVPFELIVFEESKPYNLFNTCLKYQSVDPSVLYEKLYPDLSKEIKLHIDQEEEEEVYFKITEMPILDKSEEVPLSEVDQSLSNEAPPLFTNSTETILTTSITSTSTTILYDNLPIVSGP